MTPEVADLILWELRFMRWLLIALLAVGGCALFIILAAGKALGDAGDMFLKQQNERKIQDELEDLLSRGLAKEAKYSAIEWATKRPYQVYAHWFLAKAHFQLEEWVESKKAFQTVVRVAPEWEQTVTPWLEQVEEKLQHAGPRIVK